MVNDLIKYYLISAEYKAIVQMFCTDNKLDFTHFEQRINWANISGLYQRYNSSYGKPVSVYVKTLPQGSTLLSISKLIKYIDFKLSNIKEEF